MMKNATTTGLYHFFPPKKPFGFFDIRSFIDYIFAGDGSFAPVRRSDMAVRSRAVVINKKDNVATAVVPMTAGSTVSIEAQGQMQKIKLVSEIPMGHKFALQVIPANADVIKYGEPIGRAITAIAKGEHVHVHNVVSHRARKEGN